MIHELESYGRKLNIGECTAVIISEPLKIPLDLQNQLIDKAQELTGVTFGKEMRREELAPSLFGLPNGGKKLGLVFKDDRLVSFLSGQLLKKGSEILMVNGSYVFHLSTGHSGEGTLVLPIVLKEIGKDLPRTKYVSGFTQNPRLYEFFNFISRGQIQPNHTNSDNLKDIYETVISVFGCTESVFRHKVTAGFAEEEMIASSQVMDWWTNDLKMRPQNGDLLFFVAEPKR